MASMQHIISAAEKVIGCNLSFLQRDRWVQMRAGMIVADPSHPKHKVFGTLRTKTSCLKNSFFPPEGLGPPPTWTLILLSHSTLQSPHHLTHLITILHIANILYTAYCKLCGQYLPISAQNILFLSNNSHIVYMFLKKIFLHILLSINFYFLYYIYA